MRSARTSVCTAVLLLAGSILSSFYVQNDNKVRLHFPYKEAGLTKRQAAAHLLGRFTFGAKPGDIDAVANMGLENWFEQQLTGQLPERNLDQKLSDYSALKLSNTEVVNTFPKTAKVLRMAVKDGVIDKDSVNKANKGVYKNQLAAYMQQKGLQPEKELFRQLANQKVLRAAYSNNQLQEVMTDFWFNHFNVSITKNDCAAFIPAYERDVIRPNALGKFEDLLLATAKSPAMLMYLDNFSSTGADTAIKSDGNNALKRRISLGMQKRLGDSAYEKLKDRVNQKKKPSGLNENYAREVMELHTLGADGGYTQSDVTQAARVLTGWTVYPLSDYGASNAIKKVIDRIGENHLTEHGFTHDGDFLFAANRHDNGSKVVLGKTFSAGGGYGEGVQLLKMLAHHSSAAKFICKKIAVRFASDNPPQSLIDKMVKTFTGKDGDIRQVLITMVSSPEFWKKEAVRAKTKSPFELAVSAVRSLNADIVMPYQLYNWIDKMGQKIYFYQAPTGFPHKGQYWINTGALLNRMNFGLALASQRIPGVKIDLLALNNGHEPESAEAALAIYSKIIMPERDLTETVKRLTPLLRDPELEKKIDKAADKATLPQQERGTSNQSEMTNEDIEENTGKNKQGKKGAGKNNFAAVATAKETNNMMSQVVGIIIGSPEFQRR